MKFSQLKAQYNKLFLSYIDSFQDISDFFSIDYRQKDEILKLAQKIKRRTPDTIVEKIEAYNLSRGAGEKTVENIYKLKHGACCILTGQQPAPQGGPLYNIYKIWTAISLAMFIENQISVNCVPIFWNHSDDDNIAEFVKTTFIENGTLKTFTSSETRIPAYIYDEKMVEEFSSFFLKLFDKYGLVVVEPRILDDLGFYDNVRKHSVDLINALNDTGAKLEGKSFTPSIDSVDWNGVYAMVGERRQKYADGLKFDRLSPSVFLRPILQDYIFPTVSYVGGPNEIAYMAQLKQIYNLLGVQMPAIIPRLSCTIVSNDLSRQLRKLNVAAEDLLTGDAKLPQTDASSRVDVIRSNIISELEKLESVSKEIDQALIGSLEKAKAKVASILDAVAQRIKDTADKKEQIATKRNQYLNNWLLPYGQLQERVLSGAFMIHQFPLLEHISSIDPFDFDHKVISVY